MSDGQALMPRRAGETSSSSGAIAEIRDALGLDEKKAGMNGYEVESVCLPCLAMLQGKFVMHLAVHGDHLYSYIGADTHPTELTSQEIKRIFRGL